MNLTPVTRQELETGIIQIDAVRRQRIGVRTAVVRKRALRRTVRALGRVAYDETRVRNVTLRVDGWIERLFFEITGAYVSRGATLFTIYSPALFSAQKDFLAATRGGADTGLARAARRRLELWGLTAAQITELGKRGTAAEVVPIRSPASGVIVARDVAEGSYVRAGQRLYTIAALDQVWIEVDVFEPDLALVRTGQATTVTLPYLPGRSFDAPVAYVYPYLENRTRTAKVRLELDNRDGALRPGMYANVLLEVDLGERLAVPVDAVIYTGPRRLVFVDQGDSRLRPTLIEVGARTEHYFEVESGLSDGDVVVASGNFLVAAESRIRSAADYWGASVDPT